MSLPTIADSRIAAPLYAIIVRVQMIPAREVSCLGGRAIQHLPAELLTWRLPVGQDPFNHNGLLTYKTSDPVQMRKLIRAYKNQEWV